ncbi:MAG: serine hydrolase [Chitinophagaceae bacterium]|nr:serine hydrolase [Chitinophagaceae bacterium]
MISVYLKELKITCKGFGMLMIILFFQNHLLSQRPVISPVPRDTSRPQPTTVAAETVNETLPEVTPEYKEKLRRIAEHAQYTKGIIPHKTGVLQLPPGTPSFIKDSLDAYISRGMRQWQVPGLAIGIVKDGKVILTKGYGFREAGKSEPVDENTLFFIASNTKLFTGTALAKLEADQKISLNDKVTKYIPWFRLYDTLSTRLANIKDMLCHRLGLKTFQGDFTFWNSTLPKDSIIWKMRHLKPHGEFRQDYGYCNSGYVVAGKILETVSGTSWENYVREHILKPLGMNATLMNTSGAASQPNIAYPHNNLYGALTTVPFDKIDNFGPAASMVSNVNDLCKWMLMQLDSGRYNGRTVLPWGVIQKTRDVNIITSSRKSSAFPSHFRGYGLGIFTTDYNGKQIYWHTGGAFGYVTNVCFVPELKLGITILTNNDNQSFFEALRYQILDAYLNVPYTDRSRQLWASFEEEKNKTEKQVASLNAKAEQKKAPPLRLEEYTGNYINPVYGRISISKQDDKLMCRFQHHPDLFAILEYMENQEFRMQYSHAGYGIFPAKFSVKNGKVTAVEIKVNDFVEEDPYVFQKVAK